MYGVLKGNSGRVGTVCYGNGKKGRALTGERKKLRLTRRKSAYAGQRIKEAVCDA